MQPDKEMYSDTGALYAEVSRLLSGPGVLKETLSQVLKKINEQLQWSVGLCWKTVPFQETLELLAISTLIEETTLEQAIHLAENLEFTNVTAGTEQGKEDLAPSPIPSVKKWDSSLTEAFAQKGLSLLIHLPVSYGEQLLGMIAFYGPAHCVSIPASFLCVLNDIAAQIGPFMQRLQLEETVQESERRKTGMLNAALDCIVSMDEKGNIIDFNPAAERTFGYTKEEAIGQPLADLIIPPAYREAHNQGVKRYLQTKKHTILNKRLEVIGMRRDQSEFPMELTATPLEGEIRPLFTAFMRDLTPLKNLEKSRLEAIQMVATEQRHRAEEAEAYQKKQDLFIANICHEFRNPLQGIYGSVSLQQEATQLLQSMVEAADPSNVLMMAALKESILDHLKEEQDCMWVIDKCARHQERMARDVLYLSKLDAGQVKLIEENFDAKKVLEDVISMLEMDINKKNIDLCVKFSYKNLEVYGDSSRVAQILLNLISNAIKFTPEKGNVTVSLSLGDQSETYKTLCISVEDTGMGLTELEKNKLFDRFVQINPASHLEYEGTGLGLTITKNLVELMGGQIQIESAKGQGCKFSCSLKLKTALATQEAENPTLCNKKIDSIKGHLLIVEDSVTNQKLLTRIVKQAGYTFESAYNGEAAVLAFKKNTFDLILMDIVMPVLDGLEATEAIRNIEKTRGVLLPVPIIGLSGNAQEEQKTEALKRGMDDYLIKPCERDKILSTIAYFLGRRASHQDTFELTGPSMVHGISVLEKLHEVQQQFKNPCSSATLVEQDVSQMALQFYAPANSAEGLGEAKSHTQRTWKPAP